MPGCFEAEHCGGRMWGSGNVYLSAARSWETGPREDTSTWVHLCSDLVPLTKPYFPRFPNLPIKPIDCQPISGPTHLPGPHGPVIWLTSLLIKEIHGCLLSVIGRKSAEIKFSLHIDIYRLLHHITVEYAFLGRVYRIISKIDQKPGQKAAKS